MKLNMSFLIKDVEVKTKVDKIWNHFSSSILKGFDCEPVFDRKCVETKIKHYEGKINKF